METDGQQNSKKSGRVLSWEGEPPMPDIPNVNWASLVLETFIQYENNVALVDTSTDEVNTYKDLRSKALRLCFNFKMQGIGLGDVVLLVSKNHIDIPVVFLATMLTGASCVPINPSLMKDELAHAVRVSQARWVVANSESIGKVEEAFSALSPDFLRQIWSIDESHCSRPSIQELINSGHLCMNVKTPEGFDSTRTVALTMFSSGTTGLPKGVMLSHRNLLANMFQNMYLSSIFPKSSKPPETTLLIIPMYHVYGFNVAMNALTTGGRVVVRNGFSPEEYFQTIEKYQVTYSFVVPHIIKFLSDTELMEKYDLSSLAAFYSASAPLSSSTLNALEKKSGKKTGQVYGLTETSAPLAYSVSSKPDSIGKITPCYEAKVIDLNTGDLLSEGEEGELCIRGPGVFLGYANNASATAEAIDSQGWLHTGDLVYYDKEGFLYITDRIKDIIKVKGFQVAPAEIEKVLLELDEVSDVAVVGVSNDRLGEAPRAWVVPTEGATINEEALMKHVAERLASYKQLAGGVEVVKSLPMNKLGKIERRRLRDSYKANQ